eukprot:1387248-Prymnesium_polylepis.1
MRELCPQSGLQARKKPVHESHAARLAATALSSASYHFLLFIYSVRCECAQRITAQSTPHWALGTGGCRAGSWYG